MKVRFRLNASVAIDLPQGTPFRLNGQEQTLTKAKLALCRCGQSGHKPFCDGSHKEANFVAAAAQIEVGQNGQLEPGQNNPVEP